MITISKLIVALVAVISLVNQSPSLSPAEKAKMVDEIIGAIGQANSNPVAVGGTSVTLKGGPAAQVIPSPRKASQGVVSSLVVGGENADGTRTVAWVAMDAASASVTLSKQTERGWQLVDASLPNQDGQELFWVDSGTYRWQIVSMDAYGQSMGTTTGQFIIGDN